MPVLRNHLVVAAILGTALMAPAAYSASTEEPKQVTPPPTAGGNSVEPEKTGKKPMTKGAKESTPGPNTAQPSAGGNSASKDAPARTSEKPEKK